MYTYHSSRSKAVLIYSVVGTVLITSIILLGYAVWHYTYNTTFDDTAVKDGVALQDDVEIEQDQSGEMRELTTEERETMMNEDYDDLFDEPSRELTTEERRAIMNDPDFILD